MINAMEEKKLEHYPWLDYLRAYAALWVTFYHSTLTPKNGPLIIWAKFGPLGVDLFFVLSGFLISNQVFGQLQQGQGFQLKTFYQKRAFRIWPAYFFMLLLFCFLGYGLGWQEYQVKPLLSFFTLTQNYLTHVYFSVSWSLCVEEHFYLFFPLVITLFLSKKVAPKNWYKFFIGFILIEILFRSYYWVVQRPDLQYSFDLFYRYFCNPTHVRLSGLVVGIMVALIKNFQPEVWQRLKEMKGRLFLCFLISSYFGLTGLVKLTGPYHLVNVVFSNLLTALGFGFLVTWAMQLEQRLPLPIHRFLTFTSLLSYALYLTHVESLKLTEWWFGHRPGYGLSILFIIIAYGLAYALYFCIERPFMKFRKKLITGPTVPEL